MSNEEKFEFESLQDSKSIKSFLESLTEGLERGRIELSTNGEEILLTPQSLLRFKVKAKRKKGESQIALKISWKNAIRDKLAEGAPLVISTE